MFTRLGTQTDSNNECVYNFGQKPDYTPCKHVSQYLCKIRHDIVKKKEPCRTLGPPMTVLDPPQCYLKKGARTKKQCVAPSIRCDNQRIGCRNLSASQSNTNYNKQYLDSGRLIYLERGKKDFIRDNALAVIRQPPAMPKQRIVIDSKGTLADNATCNYTFKRNFGKIPQYLIKRKQQLRGDIAEGASGCSPEAKIGCRYIDVDEKAYILSGLEKEFQNKFKLYESLPVYACEPLTLKKKEALEKELRELQNDIRLFNSNEHVFVDPCTRTFYIS